MIKCGLETIMNITSTYINVVKYYNLIGKISYDSNYNLEIIFGHN